MIEELINHLSQNITENRNALFNKVLKDRTKYITVLLEDIYQSQNASAVLRSCDCFGIHDVHVVENRNSFNVDQEVALGSSKWLRLNRFKEKQNNTLEAINHLKSEGYRIVATTPHTNDVELYDFDVSKGKAAIVFGTELTGISDVVKEHADEFLRIPMYGFTESFNISVSVALVLQQLAHQIREQDVDWQLSQIEKNEIKLDWLKTTIKSADLIEREFFKKKSND